MSQEIEQRVAALERLVAAQVRVSSTLFQLILQKDAQFGKEVAETLRQLMVKMGPSLDPETRLMFQQVRDTLVLPIPKEIEEAASQPTIRPVK